MLTDQITEAADVTSERARYDMQLEAMERIYKKRQEMSMLIVVQELMIQNNLASVSLDPTLFRTREEAAEQGHSVEMRASAHGLTYTLTKGDQV